MTIIGTMIVCAQCGNEFKATRQNARFCGRACSDKFYYENSKRVKNIAARKEPEPFAYVNVAGQVIRKPIEEHVYHPQNILKMDDRTNYYRGKGVFGYDDHAAIGYEDQDESSIE